MKLQNNICKVHVKNPSFGSLYTKGWYDANGCTPVFCSKRNKDIIWLHHKMCSANNPCAVYSDINAEENDKICEFEHLKLEHFVENQEIDWKKIIYECNLTDIVEDS